MRLPLVLPFACRVSAGFSSSAVYRLLVVFAVIVAFGCSSDDKITKGAEVSVDTGGGDGAIGEIAEDTGETDTGVDADTGVADTADTTDDAADTAEPDSDETVEDTGEPDTAGCPGGDGCDCAENSDCTSDVCLDTHEGKKCAQKCTDTCPSGYACKDIGDG